MHLIPQSVDQLLQAMVRFDTVTAFLSKRVNPEAPLAEWLESVAKSWGLATKRLPIDADNFNLLVTIPDPSPSKPWIVFESHLDTVGVEGMIVAPFGGEIKGGKLYGRGACDTKGTGASMFWALQKYAKQSNHSNNAAVVFTCGEEHQKSGAIAFAEKQLATLGWKPAGMVVGEPTMLRPVVAHNGVVRVVIRTHGVAAHSSNPANGRSAIRMMIHIIDAIEQRHAPSLTTTHPMTGKAQCSVNVIRGGTAVNIVAELCEIELDRRVVPGEDSRVAFEEVKRLLAQVKSEHPGLEFSVDEPFLDPALNPAGAGEFIDFASGVLTKLGYDPTPAGVPYGTDASNYCDAGIPTIVLGPGDILQAHTKDEWLELDQLNRAVDVYGALLATPMEGAKA